MPRLAAALACGLAFGLACGPATPPVEHVPKDIDAPNRATIGWFEGPLAAALAAAAAAGEQVIVDVGAYWCDSCHELDERVFSLPRVAAAVEAGYLAVKIDAEKDEGPEIVERYHVEAYPTVLVLDAHGVERGRIVAPEDADALLAGLSEIAGRGDPLAAARARVEADPDDLARRYELALGYALTGRRADAEAEYERVLAGDPENARGLAAKALLDRAVLLAAELDGDGERAIVLLRELQARFPASPLALRAYRSIGRELHRLGRSEEAVASLEAMIAAKPAKVALKSSYGWFAVRERCCADAGLAAVEAGLQQAPNDAELHHLRAELRDLLGDHAGALVSARRAAELEPKTAHYRRRVERLAALSEGR